MSVCANFDVAKEMSIRTPKQIANDMNNLRKFFKKTKQQREKQNNESFTCTVYILSSSGDDSHFDMHRKKQTEK